MYRHSTVQYSTVLARHCWSVHSFSCDWVKSSLSLLYCILYSSCLYIAVSTECGQPPHCPPVQPRHLTDIQLTQAGAQPETYSHINIIPPSFPPPFPPTPLLPPHLARATSPASPTPLQPLSDSFLRPGRERPRWVRPASVTPHLPE